jgi:hypothetical protein
MGTVISIYMTQEFKKWLTETEEGKRWLKIISDFILNDLKKFL